MTKSKKLFISLGLATVAMATVAGITVSCGRAEKDGQLANAQKTGSYADSMMKLASGDVTLVGAWSDARFYANQEAENLVVVGATDYISNDGVQARNTLSAKDIAAVQQLFIETIKKSQDKNETALRMEIKNKNKSIFAVYNHDSYSAITDLSTEIKYDQAGNKAKAYSKTPEGKAAEYLEIVDGKVKQVAGSKDLKIVFIPSADTTLLTEATEKLKNYFKSLGINNITISVSNDYNVAASQLKAGTIDVAFLPVDTWSKKAEGTFFILQAGRDVQIVDPYKSTTNVSTPALGMENEKELVEALNHYKQFNNKAGAKRSLYIDGLKANRPANVVAGQYSEKLKNAVDALKEVPAGKKLPTVGYYRSYIYARKGSVIEKMITKALQEQGSNWKLKFEDVKEHIIYGYTSTTSSSSFTYPEEWFKKHFTGFTGFTVNK